MEWEIVGFVFVGLYGIVGLVFQFPRTLPYSISTSLRDERLDQMRGLAMIAIVSIHIHSYFSFFHPNDRNITFYTLFLSNLSRFSVPVFIFGSSLFLKVRPDFWMNKFKSLLLPYSLASLAGYFIKYQNYSILDFSIRYLTGSVFAPYYFVPLLFQFYLIFFLIPKQLFVGRRLNFFIILSLILNVLSNIGIFDKLMPAWYAPISIFNYIFFFALGIYIRNGKTQLIKSEKTMRIALVCLFLCFLVLILFFSLKQIDFKNHHLVYPILIIFLLNSLFNSESKNVFSVALSFIGRNSLYIFLLHPFVIHQMHAFDPYVLINPYFGYIITLILNVGIPSFVAYLITYPWGNFSNQ